jgi:hypothetical protein
VRFFFCELCSAPEDFVRYLDAARAAYADNGYCAASRRGCLSRDCVFVDMHGCLFFSRLNKNQLRYNNIMNIL